jgi:hypothetical protein
MPIPGQDIVNAKTARIFNEVRVCASLAEAQTLLD